MSIIHVKQIKSYLSSTFSGFVDIDDYKNKAEQEKESAFLTRALAAFSISAVADVEPEKAALSITDGYQDNGIDAIYFDDRENILFLVQTKWHHNGSGSIERGDGLKFLTGVKDLINTEFGRFNEKIKKRSQEIQNALSLSNTRIMLLVAHTGQGDLGKDIARDFEDFLKEMNDPSDVVEFRVLRQGDLHGIVASGTLGAPINLDVVLHDWGQVREPFSAYYGCVAATDIAEWMSKYHPRIFSLNIRSFLGATEFNQGIVETLVADPENFWYFNNGVTALCSNVRKKPIGGPVHDTGYFECANVSIVNGAQTVGAIYTAFSKAPEALAKVRVMVRFISLENCPEGFAAKITRATNTQNRIETRDFVSLDPEQERLKTDLQIDGVEYVYKAGYSMRDPKNGFDLTEATVTLACSHADFSYAVQAKGKISALWEDVSKAPYKSLFNPALSGFRLWRLVQIHRSIERTLKEKQYQGRGSMLPIHGNRFIARQVFQNISLNGIDDPGKDIEKIRKQAVEITPYAADITLQAVEALYPDSYLANLFKNMGKCQNLENWIKQNWN